MAAGFNQKVKEIEEILKESGILDLVKNEEFYVGGSLPSYIFSEYRGAEKPNDIDIYTTNHELSIQHLRQHPEFKILTIGAGLLTMKSTGRDIHFIFSQTDDFKQEVLEMYDCSMVRLGYYPYTKSFIQTEAFTESCRNKKFVCDRNFTEEDRRSKLKKRAKLWYNSEIEFKNGTETINKEYYNEQKSVSHQLDLLQLVYSKPPNYLQLFHNKYKCLSCKQINDYIICKKCDSKIQSICAGGGGAVNLISGKTITIIGGINGFGNIIKNTLSQKNTVFSTGTQCNESETTTRYTFNSKMPQKLKDFLLKSDVCILNATKTLDGDESIWNTNILSFDKKLTRDRIETNVFGYTRFLQDLSELLYGNSPNKKLQLVWIDANESKTTGKMIDGKHVELNIAKAAVKQVLYTFACVFQKLNVDIICYDPGWLSYHGVALEKQKRDKLINPLVAVYGIAHFTHRATGKNISDYSIYDFLKLLFQ